MIVAAEKFWILDPFHNSLGAILSWFYALVPSYALAIILLTVTVRLLMFPLTAKQVKSQQAMQKLQPEIKRLQAKHKGDRVTLNQEMMALYQEHKVNPLAGCLPLLLQMPLFIVLYKLILNLSAEGGPKHIPTDSALYRSLQESGGKMVSWGLDLSEKASSVNGIGKAIPYYVLILLVMGTGYYQQRQLTSRMPKESINPQMQMMTKVFPAFFGLISLSIPAGVVLYFAASNLWQIGQQALTFRRQEPPVPTAADGEAPDKASKVIKAKSAPSKNAGTRDNGGRANAKAGATKAGATKNNRPVKAQKAKSKPSPGRATPPKPKVARPPASPRPRGLPPRDDGDGGGKRRGKGS